MNQSVNDDGRFISQRRNSSSKITRSKSMELTPVDDTFDEAIYAVVLTGKASETTDTDDLFQTSFGTLLDGSEFMDGIFEKHENDKVEEEEKDKMESAIHMGMKMARRCSCPSIGSYKPFDAADPSTWNKKRSKPPRQQQSKSPSRTKKEKHTSHRRSASPMVSSCVVKQQEAASRRSGEGEREGREKDRKTQHSPPSSNFLVAADFSAS